LVETTLILAGFMGLMLGMAGIGQMLFVRQTLAERVQAAARWGAIHTYDAAAIRNVVLYEVESPTPDATPFAGLTSGEVIVDNPGCPGVDCRVVVAIPGQGIQSTEPVGKY
jgi:hypothetical protein